LFLLLALFSVPAQAADCELFEGIWGAERKDGIRLGSGPIKGIHMATGF